MGLCGKKQKKMVSVWLYLNARLQPVHREEFYEELLEEILSKYKLGELLGGGTLQKSTGEIKSCAIEMNVSKKRLEHFFSIMNEIDTIPKGSKVIIEDQETELGCAEGLALHLNGTDLPEEIYENCDINYLIEQLDNALDDIKQAFSYWEGESETVLYYYGRSYVEMNDRIAEIVQKYPLCTKCKIEQIA